MSGLRSLDDGFVPPILDLARLDRKLLVSNRDSIVMTRRLADEEGIFAGVSSGAVIHTCARVAARMTRGTIVGIVCDGGWKYLSSGIWTSDVDDVEDTPRPRDLLVAVEDRRVPSAQELVAHAIADLPNECCGMIAGAGRPRRRRPPRAPTPRRARSCTSWTRSEQLRIMDEIDAAGDDLLAIYHSHTRSAAYPSRTDVELAFFPETLYLIVSIADRDAPEIRAFRITRSAPEGEQIAEEPVEVV